MIVVVAICLGSFAAVFAAKWSPRLGLDLAGGVAVVYTAEGQHVSQSDLNETVNILNLRVNGLGVSGAEVQTTGKNQISVSIPGVTDAQQVLNQIGQTARMYFRPVECYAYPEAVPKGSKAKVLPTGHRDGSGLYAVVTVDRGQPRRHAQQLAPGLQLEQRATGQPVRVHPSTSVEKPDYSDQHRAAARDQRRLRRPGRWSAACSDPPR